MSSDDRPEDTAAFAALSRALAHYKRGEQDLRSAADEAGLPEWRFLEEAHALPDPIAAGMDAGLPTFIRDRR